MELLCEVCKKPNIENYTINNPNLDEIDKLLNDYVTSQNRKFYLYALICDIYLVFDNKFKIHIETYYCLNKDDLTKIGVNFYIGFIITIHRDMVVVTLMK